MKKLFTTKSFLAIMVFSMLAFFAIPQTAKAQTQFTSMTADINYFHAVFPSTNIDSLNSVYSSWFTLAGYQVDFPYTTYADTSTGLTSTYNEPPLRFTYKLSSTLGKPKILAILQGSNNLSDDADVFTVDTLTAVNDSVETWQKNNTITFNGNKFLWYRIKWTGVTVNSQSKNRTDTYAKGEFYYSRNKKQ